jgi:hypothetical protein
VGDPAVRSVDHMKAKANELIAYHSPISRQLTLERTALGSQLIPITPYILVACAEAFYRYPDMMRAIDAALPAEEIGRIGHQPGSNINAVHLWSIANFWLTGRKVITQMDPSLDDPVQAYTVLDFWERAATSFRRHDGHRQAVDAGGVVRPYDSSVIATLLDGAVSLDDDARTSVKRFNATLVSYLFLLYFDTRVGSGDTGPYLLDDGRVLLVRDFYRMSQSDFWWSDVAKDVPYHRLTAALVLDDVDVRITDFGSSVTTPENYLDRLERFALFTTDGPERRLRPVDIDELPQIVAAVRKAQAAHYRNIAAMSRDEKIRCGAYVYFTFLKPFAEAAGVADQLDWEVPSALPEPVYQFLSSVNDQDVTIDPDAEYYDLIP